MTEKLFWENSYLIECKSRIIEVNNNIVRLDKTIVYAFSGGQKSDLGYIENFPILKAEKISKDIYYTISENHNLRVGDFVSVKIDWEHRYKIMKLHFLAELVLEIVYQNYNFPLKIGANITDEKARVDFMWEGNIGLIIPKVEEKIREIIYKNYIINTGYTDIETERRYWQIENFAKVDCGGTHVKRTGEIGDFRLKRKNISKGKERIEIFLI